MSAAGLEVLAEAGPGRERRNQQVRAVLSSLRDRLDSDVEHVAAQLPMPKDSHSLCPVH